MDRNTFHAALRRRCAARDHRDRIALRFAVHVCTSGDVSLVLWPT